LAFDLAKSSPLKCELLQTHSTVFGGVFPLEALPVIYRHEIKDKCLKSSG